MIELKHFSALEIVRNEGLVGRLLIDAMKGSKALVVQVPGYDSLHRASLSATESFFSLPEIDKQEANGTRAFSRRYLPSDVSVDFWGRSYRKNTVDVLGRERGWVPVGQSNTRVLKEYFQYGLELSANDEQGSGLIPNVWPAGNFGALFKIIKLQHLSRFTEIHIALFRAMSCALCQGLPDKFHQWPANIICRDTRYLPHSSGHSGVDTPKRNEGVVGDQGLNGGIRNRAHVDLGEGTLIKVERGLQLYIGDHSDPNRILCADEGWVSVPELGTDNLEFAHLIWPTLIV